MRSLLPDQQPDVDVYQAYRPPQDRPWLRVSMVSSLDGRVTGSDGVSGSLGGDADSLAFAAMRANADLVLVGAGTARAEGYRPASIRPAFASARRADGRAPGPVMAVVSRSLRIDPDSPLISDATPPTIVVTTEDADAEAAGRIVAAGAVVLRAGEGDVDLTAAITRLREVHGARSILCEGGPTINGLAFRAGVVDELCLTLAPSLVGGDDERRIVSTLPDRLELALTHLLEHEGELLARYRLR